MTSSAGVDAVSMSRIWALSRVSNQDVVGISLFKQLVTNMDCSLKFESEV